MAQSTVSFSSQIDAWVAKTEKRMTAVFREATQRTVSKSQENIRSMGAIDTGFMRASVQASLEAMPMINPSAKGTKGASYGYSGGEISATIAHATLGQTIYVGYTAAYAVHVHDGTSRMAPRPFVTLAAMEWPATVNQVVGELKGR